MDDGKAKGGDVKDAERVGRKKCDSFHPSSLACKNKCSMAIKSVLLLALQLPSRRTTSRTIMSQAKEYYRSDGVRITRDPYSTGMAEKYGTPGETDDEGFDPYRDSVGAGIYGGIVKRSDSGEVVIGRQYQGHNPRPGPVYAGGGYAPSSLMLDDVKGKLIPLVDKYPDLVNDITTGGAQPLHTCGMSKSKQDAVNPLVKRGADIESLDTYGRTPLHRMASNNLPIGAKMLLDAGVDVCQQRIQQRKGGRVSHEHCRPR